MNFFFQNNNKQNYLIAGPCSAESRDQLIKTAIELNRQVNLDVLRAGIWKPRTRPNFFEGVGSEGLKWLKEAGNIINKPVITEVANTKHVEEVLKHNIDSIWIGARTTVNPFLIQEIAESLKGIKIPIAIKNPVNPDVNLWIGATERILATGNNNIALIHRGFSSYGDSKFRNIPKWEIPIEMMRNFPDLPMYCDPSHIGGKRTLIYEIAQKALDLNMDGLMIESHIDPNQAKSDSKQQLLPNELKKTINKLIIKKVFSENKNFINALEETRTKIDSIDYEILNLFKQRFNYVKDIGTYKKQNKVTIYQPDRWNEIIKTRIEMAKELGINEEYLRQHLELIHKESILIQTEIFNKKKNE